VGKVVKKHSENQQPYTRPFPFVSCGHYNVVFAY